MHHDRMQVLSCAIASMKTDFPRRCSRLISESLESEFESLLAKIDEVRKQFDVRIVAAEEALTVVHAMRNVEKIAIREARR